MTRTPSRLLHVLVALVVLLQVPHHLVELVFCDLSPSISFSEDVVGLITIPPVSAWAVAPPRPEGPAKEPEDCEYPEETEESKWEEAEAVWIVTYRPEEDPANCRDCRDYRYES